METETLSSYEKAQDKHVLDDSMDVNIPRNEAEVKSRRAKEVTAVNISGMQLKTNDTTDCEVYCESSENKEEENDCDQIVGKVDEENSHNELDSEEETAGNEKEAIENEEKSPTNSRLNDTESNSAGESDIDEKLVSRETDPIECHEENHSNDDVTVQSDPLTDEEKGQSESEQNYSLDSQKSRTEKDEHNEGTDKENVCVTEKEPGLTSQDEDEEPNISDSSKIDGIDKENVNVTEEDKDAVKDQKETRETEANLDKKDTESTDDGDQDISRDCPLLKETLSKPRSEDGEQQKETECENGMEDIDMDDDFDPSLLCPDIAMEVDEAPVTIANNDNPPGDGSKSPLLYENVFSTYVDEMTGAEVSFNLTPEEHKLRQETYGNANPIQFTKVHCTACNVHLGSALDGQSNRFVHPLLKVLICKDCYHFYTSGEFEKDEDGSELYCRWCGQGGQVICCSSCEMVFCKKCIRINFGRKKLTEIRDSDEWLCFRCNPLQLTSLRVHCAEFMEYVRREISRAATLENATSFMTTDYTQCCLSQKKKYVDPHSAEPKRKRRKLSLNDPDYDPMKDRTVSPQPSTSTATSVETPTQKLVPILPKVDSNAGVVTKVVSSNNVFRVGNTTFRPRTSSYQPRPRVQVINPTNTPRSSGPGYIKILPGGIRMPPSPTRNSFTPRQSFQQRAVRPAAVSSSNQMKHEWFEKTVRAAARVNSNLSYTLTQLNRAQASATSVEALAVVHNKLQEILSTSINSLIQIRKNLRTEFIAGIKNIRFPPKPQPSQPSTSAQDDDVIFVSPTTSPVPPPLLTTVNNSSLSLSPVTLPPSISLTKRTPTSSAASTSSMSGPSNTGDDKPKVFLRVKSLTALQNVPSECITIPDDPLPSPPPLTLIPKPHEITVENCFEKVIEKKGPIGVMDIKIQDILSVSDEQIEKESEKSPKDSVVDISNGHKEESVDNQKGEETKEGDKRNDDMRRETIEEKDEGEKKDIDQESDQENQNNIKGCVQAVSPSILKKMKDITVHITRSEEIDKMVRKSMGLVNGDTSD